MRLTTGGSTRDVEPVWSPDGSRIAYARSHILARGPIQLCVVSVDGTGKRCWELPGLEFRWVKGWEDPLHVVGAFADSAGRSHIAAVNVRTGEHHDLAVGELGFRSDAPGWIVCFCRRSAEEPDQLLLMPTAAPGRAVRLDPPSPPGDFVLLPAGRVNRYINRLKIVTSSISIPLENTWQLGLRAWDAAGAPRQPMAVRWWSSDTMVAAVDSTGAVRPRRSGSITIYATTGGWRSDSVRLRVVPAATVTLLAEDWRRGITSDWVPFGTPRPFVTGTDSGPALVPNGDSTFNSGVLTRRLWPTGHGLGVEFAAAMPLTARQWQYMQVSLVTADSATMRPWDLPKGQIFLPDGSWRGCAAFYPPTGFPDLMTLSDGVERSVRVPPGTSRGEWVRIRLQLFPDGRCGLALNGVARAVLDRSVPVGDSAMLLIRSMSFHTRFLVGPIELWEGVRAGVDWSRPTNR